MAATNTQLYHRASVNSYLKSHSNNTNRKADSENKNKKPSSSASTTSSSTHSIAKVKSQSQRALRLPTISHSIKSKTTATINNCPDEILAIIFWKLQVGDLVNVSQVCKRWHKVANDNSLWKYLYARFVGSTSKEKEDTIPIQELENGCWKNLCLKQCQIKRDKIYLKKWKQPDSYTGLKQRPMLTLSKVGVTFEISLIDTAGLTWSKTHCDIYWQTMSTSVRWYDLTFPDLRSIRFVRIHACSPLMFYGPSKPAKDGILQKSLLTEFKGDFKEAIGKLTPVGTDSRIILYELISGLIVGLYKSDGEIAFITVSYHYQNFISRCLCGTPERCWGPPEVEGEKDDIDPQYGLHGYTCVLQLRNMRQKLLDCKFSDLFTTKNQLNAGFAVFNPVRKDDKMTHIACPKDINFPWKTNLFKGIVKNVGILDVTILDERGEPFWTVTSSVAVKQSSQTNQFDFDPGNYQSIHYEDGLGKIDLDIGQLDDGELYVSYVLIALSLEAINKTFSTSY